MTRGRPPSSGLKDAILIARTRGTVLCFENDPGYPANFLILGNEYDTLVRVRRKNRLHCTVPELEREFSETIVRFNGINRAGTLRHELWVYSKYGSWRFFRVEKPGLVEISREGEIM
jgi:hypothetical protein